MSPLTQTEKLVHQAILSSLVLFEIQSDKVAAAAGDIVAAMRACSNTHRQLARSLRDGDFCDIGAEATLGVAFHLEEIVSRLDLVLRHALNVASMLPPHAVGEHGELVRQLQLDREELEELAETWNLAADPFSRASLLDAVHKAEKESASRQIGDWRDFIASVQD